MWDGKNISCPSGVLEGDPLRSAGLQQHGWTDRQTGPQGVLVSGSLRKNSPGVLFSPHLCLGCSDPAPVSIFN